MKRILDPFSPWFSVVFVLAYAVVLAAGCFLVHHKIWGHWGY